jgi:hypothetical protein
MVLFKFHLSEGGIFVGVEVVECMRKLIAAETVTNYYMLHSFF